MKPSNDQILELFNKLDEKKLGYLDIDTISNALKNQFQNQNIHINNRNYYAKELVRICDKTNSGQVTLQEFKDFILEKDLQLQSLFKKISQNGKYIGLEKLETSVKEAGYDVSSKDLQSLLAEIDYNKDGVIDYSEWRDFLLLLPHKPTFINIFKFFSTVSNVDFNSDANALPSSDTFNFTLRLKYLLAGGVAGAVSRTATAPLDRLKVLLQTDTHNHRAYSHWVSIKKGVNIIYNDGGIRSFFKGNGLNCLKIIPESALKFYVFETSKDLLSDYYKVNKDDLGISSRFLAGGMAGLISQFAIYPMETIKTRLMAQIKSHPKARPSLTVDIESNISTTVRNLYRENGIRAFYRGCIPALIGIVPYAGIDLAVFETLKLAWGNFQPDSQRMPIPVMLSCGMFSGMCGAVICYPLGLIRTRLQAQGTLSHPTYYNSSFDVIRKTYQLEGLIGFYRGLAPTLLKVLPAISISYVVYEHSKLALNLE